MKNEIFLKKQFKKEDEKIFFLFKEIRSFIDIISKLKYLFLVANKEKKSIFADFFFY